MFKSLITFVFRFIASLTLGVGLALGYIWVTLPEPYQSAFTHDEVAKINPVMVIDGRTLIDNDRFSEALSEASFRLIQMGVAVPTAFGIDIPFNSGGYSIPVIIQSQGGYIKLANQITLFLSSLKQAGYKISCYVGEAQSAAMHILVTSCDRVVAKRSAKFMQHRTHCGYGCSTPATVLTDLELSRKEANALGVKFDEWHNLARGPEDHVFNLLEIEKYKLVDEWMD